MQTAAGKGACAPKIAPRVPVCPLVRTSRNSTSARGFIDGRQPIAGGSVAVAKPQSFQERSLVVLDYNDLASGNHLHAQIEEVRKADVGCDVQVRNCQSRLAFPVWLAKYTGKMLQKAADAVYFLEPRAAHGLLLSPLPPLRPGLPQALGPNGLGALAVRNVPGYVARRRLLLPQAHAFAVRCC